MGKLPSNSGESSGHCFTPLGGHEAAIAGGQGSDGGDVLQLRIHGPVELLDAKLALDLLERVAALHHRVFMIVHMVGAGGFKPEARRYYLDRRKQQSIPNRWVYVISPSRVIQTLITLVQRGAKLLTGHEPAIQLVGSEAEAIALIDALRVRLIAKQTPAS